MVDKTRLYNWYISLVAASCMILYGYDASVFNAIQGSENWKAYFNEPDAHIIGAINTAYTVGAIVAGFFFGGPIADFLGRRWGMAIGCILVIIATFVQTFSPRGNVGCFIGGRVIIGIAQGIALTSGSIYIGELAPSDLRGTIMSIWQAFYSVGSFIAFWIRYATVQNVETLGEWDWKLVVILQIMAPTVILSQIFFCPESPRYLIHKKGEAGIEKARRGLRRVRKTDEEVEDEVLQIREALEYEKEAISSTYTALWKDKSLRKRMYLALIINAGQQITGQGSLNSYSTIIYENVFPNESTIQLINALNATFGILFTLNATWTVDRFGRKFLLVVGGIGMACCMLMVTIIGVETPGDQNKTKPVGIAIVFSLFLFAFFYKPSWGATVWIITAEMFSMNVRAQAVGMASQTQNVANAIFNQFFPIFLENCGWYSFILFMGINICLAAFVWFFVPETKNVSLEEMDAKFGGSNHVTSGGAMMDKQDPHHAYENEDGVTLQEKREGAEHVQEVKA
ncbi:hypothetical protein MBLNU230_g1169t1 [Neophaeotheca triangularis]